MDSYSCGYKGIGLYLYEQWIAAIDRILRLWINALIEQWIVALSCGYLLI